ncbi:MAG TPA: phosphotransferase [Streptosporangiaceae bacterium]|nr:phosphotransferase [Streptosporangiaceae bacterium]
MTTGLVRRGDRLWRPTGPWSPAVHEYLRHLESAGFRGAPRLIRLDGDHEVLTYIEGEVAADPHWHPGHGHRLPGYTRTIEALRAAARLLRELHEAVAGFSPRKTGYRFHPHPPRPGEIICHGDLGPWNTVYRDGVPVAFIDWDSAEPARPLTDLAAAAWAFVPLAPAGQLAEAGFDAASATDNMITRLGDFAAAYGLDDPRAILPELVRSELASASRIRHVAPTAASAADSLEHLASRVRWIDQVLPRLAQAL